MKRVWTAAAALMAAAMGLAQPQASIHQSARQWFAAGVELMAPSSSLSVLVQGYEVRGSVQTPIRVSASVQKSLAPSPETSWMEVMVYRDGLLSHRLVGDGERVWTYSTRTREYASAVYQNPANPTDSYLSRMLLLGARWSPREADFAVRLLRDILDGGSLANRWTPWLSGVSQVSLTEGRLMTDLTYTTPHASLTYRFERAEEEDPWELTRVLFQESREIGGEVQGVYWQAEVLPGLVDTTATYTFLPPAGSRARAIGG